MFLVACHIRQYDLFTELCTSKALTLVTEQYHSRINYIYYDFYIYYT